MGKSGWANVLHDLWLIDLARFLTRKQTQLTDAQLQKLLHHISVEVLALKSAGRDVLEVCNARRDGGAQRTTNVTILAENGVPTLKFENDADEQAVLSAIEELVEPESEPVSEKSLLYELRNATTSTAEHTATPSWMSFELGDPKMKLAVSASTTIERSIMY